MTKKKVQDRIFSNSKQTRLDSEQVRKINETEFVMNSVINLAHSHLWTINEAIERFEEQLKTHDPSYHFDIILDVLKLIAKKKETEPDGD